MQSRRADHVSNIVAHREFSTGCYLFTVSNSDLLSVTKRVSTTPSQPRPLRHRQPCGFDTSNDRLQYRQKVNTFGLV